MLPPPPPCHEDTPLLSLLRRVLTPAISAHTLPDASHFDATPPSDCRHCQAAPDAAAVAAYALPMMFQALRMQRRATLRFDVPCFRCQLFAAATS